MDLKIKNKVFVVTGGTDGLGFATAQALLGEGAKVLVTGRTEEKFQRAKKQLGELSANISFFAGDNGDPQFTLQLKEAVLKQFGQLDGFLISVGGPPASKALTTTDEMWRLSFESVFLGTTRLIKELSSIMSDGGAIALVLSTSAKVAIPTIAISNGFRPGLAMLVKNYADELGSRDIRINALLPGMFATDRVKHLYKDGPRDFSGQSIKRLGEPEEFGRTAAFLLSPVASFTTGTTVIIDGGQTKAL